MEQIGDPASSLLSKLARGETVQLEPEELERVEREQAAVSARVLGQHHERNWEQCGAPKRVRTVLDAPDFHDGKAVARVKSWVAERERAPTTWALVLSSGYGTGKSVAAGLWLRELKASPIKTYDQAKERDKTLPSWWPVSWLVRMPGFSGDFEAVCSHDGPLVVDDLGAEYLDKAGWFLQVLDGIVDARYRECRPTCITTNLGAEDFRRRYGGRIGRRLREGGAFYEFQSEPLGVSR
jgi:hypothetical protein